MRKKIGRVLQAAGTFIAGVVIGVFAERVLMGRLAWLCYQLGSDKYDDCGRYRSMK